MVIEMKVYVNGVAETVIRSNLETVLLILKSFDSKYLLKGQFEIMHILNLN